MSRRFSTETPLGQYMELYGWTATDFAAMTGVHPRTLTEYLSGRQAIRLHHLVEFSRVLDVDADILAPNVQV